jgi:hypothetical protein
MMASHQHQQHQQQHHQPTGAVLPPLEQEAARLAEELVRQQEAYGVSARNVDYLERELERLRAVSAAWLLFGSSCQLVWFEWGRGG